MLLHREVPADAEQSRCRCSGGEGGEDEQQDGRLGGEDQHQRRPRDDAEHADEQRPAEPHPQRTTPARNMPAVSAASTNPQPAGRGGVGDGRPEGVPAGGVHGVDDAEGEHDHPEPGPGPELGPALAQLDDHVARRHPLARRDPDRGEAGGGDEGRTRRRRRAPNRVRPPRPARRPAEAPATIAAVVAIRNSTLAGCRSRAGTVCGSQAGAGREGERGRGAVDRLDRHQGADRRVVGEQQGRGQCLGAAADDVGHDEHQVPRQPVGQHAAEQQEDDLRDRCAPRARCRGR